MHKNGGVSNQLLEVNQRSPRSTTRRCFKRCYIDGLILKSDCPKCGMIIEVDMSDQYFSEFDGLFEVGSRPVVGFMCQIIYNENDFDVDEEVTADEGCGHEWMVHYRAKLVFTEARKEEYR